MADVTYQEMFATERITEVISRIKTPMSRFQDFMGMGPGGSNSNPVGGKYFGWDIFDRTRSIATGRPAGTGPASANRQIVGHKSASAYRIHEKIHLQEERVFNTRRLGANWGVIDARGQRYVTEQERYLSQRVRNNREFMISQMLQGGFGVWMNGDDWKPTLLGDTGAAFSVTFDIPADNLPGGAVAGLVSDWQNSSTTDIPGQILDLNAKFEELHGMPLRHVWVTSSVMKFLMSNDEMQGQAGTANRVFEVFQPTGLTNVEGIQDTGFNVTFMALPWLTFHQYDGGLDIEQSTGTAFQKLLSAKGAIFLPDPSSAWSEWYDGSEIVAENVMDPGAERYGMSAWATRVIDPAGFDLKVLDVGLPVLYVPKAVVYSTVDGS